MRRSPFRLSLFLFLAAGVIVRAEGDPTYAALRGARPDGKAFAVHHLVLERDVFRFTFEDGTFQFLTPVNGRSFGAVFSGQATLELRPSSPIERRYLAFVTGDPKLEILTESKTSVVLLFGDATAAEIEKQGSAAPALPEAGAVYQAAFERQRTEWRSNLQIRLLADALGTSQTGGVFLAMFTSKKSPPALLAVDPGGLDWLAPGVGSEGSALFVLDGSHRRLWYCSPMVATQKRQPSEMPGPTARATHYSIDTTIKKNTELDATATIRFEPLEEGLRVLPIDLVDKQRIREASFAPAEGDAWKPLVFIQEPVKEDAEAAVVFPAPLARGKEMRLRLAYGGKEVLENAGDGNFVVGARESWYPNLGVFSTPASFELTYHCPKDNQVVSVGQLEQDRIDGDVHVQRFVQSRPVRVAGFNYGKFQKIEKKDPDSGETVTVYTNIGTPDFIREINVMIQGNTSGLSYIPVDTAGFADAAMADGINMIRVGSAYFGPLPEKRIAITQQTQVFFGQSWPSLVYLPFLAALDGGVRRELGLQDTGFFVDEVGPHEVAHQWWGHLVGWNNYRDQWLSEGFAQFSVSLVLQGIENGKKLDPFWERARRNILAKPRGSAVSNVGAGPITLGWRLSTPLSPDAYQAMVYDKGAYVLHMLRMAMMQHNQPNPDANFIATMQDFVTSYSDKNPSTHDFQTVVERHMVPPLDLAGDGRMDWFFRQWVDGTEIPHYDSKLEISKVGADQYRIHGTVSQDGVSDDFRSAPHLYAELSKGRMVHLGTVRLTGNTKHPVDASARMPEEPKRIVLNAMHDVLSRD